MADGTVLDYTGERMVPEAAENSTFWEHIYRYNFATQYARGKDVLDIACGEGYGSAALRDAGAKSCIGVDVDPASCNHAIAKYGLDARVGSAESIPLPDRSVDLVVSFETIEHVPDPKAMLAECRRILRPNGMLIISTPDKSIYGASGNPYHCSEMTLEEFQTLLANDFPKVELYCQRATRGDLRMPSSYFHFRKSLGLISRIAGTIFNPLLSPGYSYNPSPTARSNVQHLIGTRTRPGACLLNPFLVRPVTPHNRDCPMYYLAVARVAS